MKIKLELIIGNVFLLFYILFVVIGSINYQMLPQVTVILDSVPTVDIFSVVEDMFLNLHPHALRTLLMLPIYFLSDILPLDTDVVFGIFIVLCIYASSQLVIYMGMASFIVNLVVLCFFFALLLAMNGRIAFAIWGNTLILYALFKRHYIGEGSILKFLFLIMLGLLFCSVSSGTTFVAIVFLVCFYLVHLLLSFPKINKKILLSFCLVITLLLWHGKDMLTVYLYKNLTYYDGSVYNMLSHGVGKYTSPYFLIVVPLLLVLAFLMLRLFKRYSLLILPSSLVASSILVGLFGFSSLVSGVSGFVLLPLLYVKKNNTK